jgi:UPF0755 protein
MSDDAQQLIPQRRQPKKLSKRGRTILLSVVSVVLVVALIGAWLLLRTEKSVPAGNSVTVVIQPGESTAAIGRQLAYVGVVPNSLMFRLQARFLANGKLKDGDYKFKTGMSYDAVIKKMVAGPDIVYYDVVIPEGFTAKQVARRLAARAMIPEDELMSLVTSGAPEFEKEFPFLKGAYGGSLEGYLFPKTYRIKEGTSAKAALRMMLGQFNTEIAGIDLSYAKKHGIETSGVVTIASIIEKEVKLQREYPMVASVIYNRLAKPMRLQLDSTIFYFLPEGETHITNADLFNMSPYNTYRRMGLPPGPLSNPGIEALQAAAKPSTTNYYYYILTGKDGSQTFATTYEQFLVAKKKYKEVFGK